MSRKFPPLKRAAAWKPTGEDLTWLLAEFVELSASVEIDRCTSAEERAAAWKPTGEDLTWLLAEFVELSASVEIDRCTSAEERAGLKTDRERAAKILEAIRPMLFPA